MKRLVFDLDGTLTIDESSVPYQLKRPNLEIIEKLKEYKKDGFEIIISTARNMNSYQNSIGLINANTLPIVIDWLRQHDVPFDEIYIGKPWCGAEGFYIDDKSIRPKEFIDLNYQQILKLFE